MSRPGWVQWFGSAAPVANHGKHVPSSGLALYAMALDLQKAFDSTDWTVCLKLLKHAGLQAPILKLLVDQ